MIIIPILSLVLFIPRDALKGHRRGKKRGAYVFITRDALTVGRTR